MPELETGKILESHSDRYTAVYAFKYESLIPYERDSSYQEETYRTRFRRDKDRILYSESYRRLQNKTQVFANNVENSVRTRLTHTLEVQQLATSIADALRANRDLAEAIAVGHDIGHTPFGHAVERELNRRMIGSGGYSHSIQSLRCLTISDICVHDQVLEGMLKHDTEIFIKARQSRLDIGQYNCSKFIPARAGTIEAQIVFWSDKIAYLSHDWDDFSKSNIFSKMIRDGVIKWDDIIEQWRPLLNEKGIQTLEKREIFEIRDLIRTLTTNLIKTSQINLAGVTSSEEAIEKTEARFNKEIDEAALFDENCRNCETTLKNAFRNGLLVNFDDEMRSAFFKVNNDMIKRYFLSCSEVSKSDYKAVSMIGKLFEVFRDHTELLPPKTKAIINKGEQTKERIIIDHLSGMTDQYAERLYRELFL